MLYNTVLVPVTHQHESDTGASMSPPSRTPFPTSLPIHPCVPWCFYPARDSSSFSDYTVFIKFGGIISANNFLISSLVEISTTIMFSSVQSLSHVQLFATPGTAACQASLSITHSQNPSKPICIELVMPSNHLILCHPLLLLPSIFPSIRVFSKESALCIRWSKYWIFSFNMSPSNEHPGLISFRMGWLYLLAVQGTFKSLLQHHSSKTSILWCSAFFIVQLSHLYLTTGKTIALTRQTFVDKVMSLLFNMLSRLVLTFLPKSKCLLISWL